MWHAALLLAIALGFGAASASAQQGPSMVEGTVLTGDGERVVGVNVFLYETLEGDLTDSTGGFRFETSHQGPALLILMRPGFAEERRAVDLPLDGPFTIALTEVVEVEAITVRAGGYTAGDEPGSTLTSLDVVTTPGAQASVPLAIKTLPGVQNVDDGAGVFVRGGDAQETRFFLNDAGVIDAVRPREPTGSDAPQIDPFLLNRIFFSSGAFGARYGNALSAVIDLQTRGRPDRFQPSAGAHMAGVEGAVEGPLGERLGGALTLSRLHIGPIYAVNGSTRDYGKAPQGWEASGSLVWDYREAGQLKAFTIGETFETAFEVDEASFRDEYEIESESGAAIVTWRDHFGTVEPVVSLSHSGERSEETGGAFRLVDDRASTQAFAAVAVPRGTALVLSAGAEIERLDTRLSGEFPSDAADRGEDASTDAIDFGRTADRVGLFVESEWAVAPWLALTAGLRTDRSTLSRQRTWDPRLSFAWNPTSGVSLLLGGGVYHQVADPLLYARSEAPPLASQRAVQLVAGVQAGNPSEKLFRVEAYVKEYDELAQLDREDRAIGGGEGNSRGIDVFVKGRGPWGTNGWISYSVVDAERTDPDTGEIARAPFDVTQSLIAVVGREIRPGWNARAAWRYATGRPFTDVTGAVPGPDGEVWIPAYGEPFGARQPAFHRLDLSFSRLVFFGEDGLLVVFASINNVYDRFNLMEYRWAEDYSRRFPVQDRTPRRVFVGISIEF
ncbi:MAG: TonB-dependent receptor [Gemmatimonadota bacterium]